MPRAFHRPLALPDPLRRCYPEDRLSSVRLTNRNCRLRGGPSTLGWIEAELDRYLEIAVAVLRSVRRPLGPKAILSAAYKAGLVPAHLYGKTQHKTLQARISEDIITRRERSPFFRTAPGLFFLRDFLTDNSLPEKYRRPIATRRRVRELIRGPALAVEDAQLSQLGHRNGRIETSAILSLLHTGHITYGDPKTTDGRLAFVWSFVSVCRSNLVLSYRQGRYRDSRDSFMLRRTIGFSTLVHQDESTLFNISDFGIVDSGVHAAMLDLDIPEFSVSEASEDFHARLKYFIWVPNNSQSSDLVAVIDFHCPDWFEPMKRRLAINDLRWLDLSSRVNDLDDFDPWSKFVMVEDTRLKEDKEVQSA